MAVSLARAPGPTIVVLIGGLVGCSGGGETEEIAPELSAQMVHALERQGPTITLLGGGSRHDAHVLWERYHDRRPAGEPPESPQLLGISLAKVEMNRTPGSGTYWVVYSDRVWSPSFGLDGSGSGFAHEVILVDPESLRWLTVRTG